MQRWDVRGMGGGEQHSDGGGAGVYNSREKVNGPRAARCSSEVADGELTERSAEEARAVCGSVVYESGLLFSTIE